MTSSRFFVREILKLHIPADLCINFDRPAKEDVNASNVPRFNQGVVVILFTFPHHQGIPDKCTASHKLAAPHMLSSLRSPSTVKASVGKISVMTKKTVHVHIQYICYW